ncbi:hypothetical protein [Pseudalkalibacillus salsuginis]|uniref:hypothetical protein n=1 Tax=Pseudalkalibacillus salsuginis TaxID=2910972 RepID=UPI001F219C10|nr:hypothetical protein [Pseudalkalibacillus salsuginis]MCF6411541.1 hypothetical protein [Pseudalkalibacillus salsuginis]
MGKYKKSDRAETKKRCRLNENDIRMAKELGMTPKSLIKKVWIRDIYENKFGKVLGS